MNINEEQNCLKEATFNGEKTLSQIVWNGTDNQGLTAREKPVSKNVFAIFFLS